MAVGSGLTAPANGLFMVRLVVLGLCNVQERVKAQASFKTVAAKRPNEDSGGSKSSHAVCVCLRVCDGCVPVAVSALQQFVIYH